MKTFIKIKVLALVAICFISCGDNEKGNNNLDTKQNAPDETEKKGPMTDRYHLFTFNSTSEIEAKLTQTLIDINNASTKEINTSDDNLASISMDVVIADGQGLLTEWRTFDRHGKLVDRFVFNTQIGNYESIPLNVTDDGSTCPTGFTYLGTCAYGADFGNCVANASVSYVVSALTTNQTATITVTNTLSFARVCGKKSS